MSRFYVGQRVRIARKTTPYAFGGKLTHVVPGMIGTEATVVGTISHPNEGFDAHGVFDTSIRIVTGLVGMVPAFCLEPATDSYDKIEWSECIWKPDHMREAV